MATDIKEAFRKYRQANRQYKKIRKGGLYAVGKRRRYWRLTWRERVETDSGEVHW